MSKDETQVVPVSKFTLAERILIAADDKTKVVAILNREHLELLIVEMQTFSQKTLMSEFVKEQHEELLDGLQDLLKVGFPDEEEKEKTTKA